MAVQPPISDLRTVAVGWIVGCSLSSFGSRGSFGGKGIDEGHGGMMCPLGSKTKLGQTGEGGELGEMAVAAQLGGREVKVQVLEGELAVD